MEVLVPSISMMHFAIRSFSLENTTKLQRASGTTLYLQLERCQRQRCQMFVTIVTQMILCIQTDDNDVTRLQ